MTIKGLVISPVRLRKKENKQTTNKDTKTQKKQKETMKAYFSPRAHAEQG
jgi:hypothetical protein